MRFFLCLLILYSAILPAEDRISSHSLQTDKGPLAYTATVGSMPVKDAGGEVKGEIGYIAYVKEGSLSERPVTFAFNGGPGSSSVWLHIGTFGPRRVISPDEGQPPAPPYQLVDNLETILDLTDLIFIDPMGTGFSKACSKEDAKPFYDAIGDIRSIGDFIRDYITVNGRWNSPRYLAGESYGTARACGLADYLQDEYKIYLNGVILISCAIDFQTLRSNQDNFLPYLLFVPTYTATAWHHGRYRPESTLEEVAEEARRFAYETLSPSLLRRSFFSRAETESLYTQFSKMTGLPFELIDRYKGRIDPSLFFLEFFGQENKVIGRFDSRFIGDVTLPGSSRERIDPSGSSIMGIFTGAFQDYLARELGCYAPYTIISNEAHMQWTFGGNNRPGYFNLMGPLRRAMVSNPTLKVFVGCGYFDAATPFAAAEYCFDHLDLPDAYHAKIQMEYYKGGHMYYLVPSERVKFKQDLVRFYEK